MGCGRQPALWKSPASPPENAPVDEERDTTGDPKADPPNLREIEDELDGVILQLTTEKSKLAFITLLPHAKKLYEALHPEAKHGGVRNKQDPENGSCKAFVKYIADRAGVSKNTIYSHLDRAADLAGLAPEAEALCYGCGLANDIGMLTRLAHIPKKEMQRDVANIYRHGAGRKEAKEQLNKWEDEFGIKRPERRKKKDKNSDQETDTDEERGAGDDNTSSEKDDSADAPDAEDVDNEIEKILVALGVGAVEECVPAIDALKAAAACAIGPEALSQAGALQATIHELRGVLAAAEAKSMKLEAELAMYRGTPLAELFRVLGATSAREALGRARSLTEGPNAPA